MKTFISKSVKVPTGTKIETPENWRGFLASQNWEHLIVVSGPKARPTIFASLALSKSISPSGGMLYKRASTDELPEMFIHLDYDPE
jgi:hypothetical protein